MPTRMPSEEMSPSGSPMEPRPELRRRPSFRMSLARFLRRNALLVAIIILILVIVGAFEGGRYSVYQAHPDLAGQDQANAILAKVSQLIQLPQDEAPTLARVTNADEVKQAQPFFANAQDGDILIVYQNAQTAILYRPSTNKLIAVGPVTPQTSSRSTAEAPIQETPPAPSDTTKSSSTDATSTSQ